MLAWFLGITIPLIYLAGIYSGIDALMRSRNAQSTTAWILGLTFIPFVTLPLYWVFGRHGYTDYFNAQVEFDELTADLQASMQEHIANECEFSVRTEQDQNTRNEMTAFERFGDSPFTRHNQLTLLINGENTFNAIFSAIETAQHCVLVQFYVVHDDTAGQHLQELLIQASQRGVAVYFLYDEIGCLRLPDSYLEKLRSAGIQAAAFSGERGSFRKFRLNFRNHRKIVVVDGRTAFVGGHNVGNEYWGSQQSTGSWRDTHAQVDGPAALELQLSFLRDWYFSTSTVPGEIRIKPHITQGAATVQIVCSGPHETISNCGLLFAHLIASAERQLWIATPYLVPDGHVLGALQLAGMRGVDVRLLVPRTSNHIFFKFVPYAFIKDIMRAGCRVFFYEKSFMHQKILLVDNDYGVVSTANFDNRSFHLNFEVNCIVRDSAFCRETQTMLEDDFSHATEISVEDVESRPFLHRLATQATRLLAPIL